MKVRLVLHKMSMSENADVTELGIMGTCYMVFIHSSVENRFGTAKWRDASLSVLAQQSLMYIVC